MERIAGFPYWEARFKMDGEADDPHAVDTILTEIREDPEIITDLIILVHGWNNTDDEARNLYRNFAGCLRNVLNEVKVPTGAVVATYAVLGVLWPSKKFPEHWGDLGGAAGLGDPVQATVIEDQIEGLIGVLGGPESDRLLNEAKALVPSLEDQQTDRGRFAELIRSAIPHGPNPDETDGSDSFFRLRGDQLMARLDKPVRAAPPSGWVGGATSASQDAMVAGQAAGLFDQLGGVWAAASHLLNYTTFYEMKERAGSVGRAGLAPLMSGIRSDCPDMKIHLVGHSFGARLITAATAALADIDGPKPHSLVLLQGAFSHNAFADKFEGDGGEKPGGFRSVISAGLVAGPIVITKTINDEAVGLAYPLASMIAGQDSAGLGDQNSRFGGLGRNGALHTPEAIDGNLLATGSSYGFSAGHIYNLNADAFIANHSDICKDEVAHAALAAMGRL